MSGTWESLAVGYGDVGKEDREIERRGVIVETEAEEEKKRKEREE